MVDTATITCKSCGNQFTGNYCNHCGEKVYTEHDKTFFHFFEEGFHFITHFEGKFFTTLKTLFLRPGQVSLDYSGGIRKKYFKLLSLFLLVVIIYLLFPYFEGLNMRLYHHMRHAMYGGYATRKVESILREKPTTEAALSDLFHKKAESISKTLLVVIIPLTALAFWAVSFRRKRYFFDQMVLATEVNCFYLIWGFLLAPLLFFAFQTVYHWIAGGHLRMNDDVVGLVVALPLAVFVGRASRRFYRFGGWPSVLFAAYFVIMHTFIVHYLYKFILFVAVIHQLD